jgi:rfaE bifunctional protein nucleotidyltransferase chain/domain
VTKSAAKIRSLAEAVAWRAGVQGPVVFTNGVFDLVHLGHVALLEAARREGSALIVGVNSDASARRLKKGPGRPIMSQTPRAGVVAAMASVDCVVLFEEDTPIRLIESLQPDVLVKGADYTREAIVGAEVVEARGGRVVRVPLVDGVSTSAIVERLRAPS